MEPLGDYLKREREFRNISLEEISRTTKIRESILRALEEDRLDPLGSPIFIKGYLRAYASYVGLDPNDVVLRYEASLKEEKEPRVKKAVEDTPSQWRLKYIVLPVSVLLMVGVLLFLALRRPATFESEPEQMAKPVTPPASRPEPTTSTITKVDSDSVVPSDSHREESLLVPPPIPSPPRIPPSLSETSSGIELQLRALEDTWLQIKIDQNEARGFLLKPGEVISRQGERHVEMTIGNAGGLEISHNGKNLGLLGESGKVVHLSITPEEVVVRASGASLPKKPSDQD